MLLNAETNTLPVLGMYSLNISRLSCLSTCVFLVIGATDKTVTGLCLYTQIIFLAEQTHPTIGYVISNLKKLFLRHRGKYCGIYNP